MTIWGSKRVPLDTQNLNKCKGGPTKIDKEGPSKTRREENDTKRDDSGYAAVNQAKTFSFLRFLDIDTNLQPPATPRVQAQGKG